MKLMFTDTFEVDTTGVLIHKGAGGSSGEIPEEISVRAISLEPASVSDALKVKGINEGSAWIALRAGSGFILERLVSDDRRYCYIAASSGSINVNLYVEGT